jgi:hypothetical protein
MRYNAGWMMENDEPTIGFVAPLCRLDSRLAMQNAFVSQQLDGSAARSVQRGLLLCEGARNDDQTSCEKCEISHVKGMGSNETQDQRPLARARVAAG